VWPGLRPGSYCGILRHFASLLAGLQGLLHGKGKDRDKEKKEGESLQLM